jgi:cytochrome c oxidase subunit IV
MSDHSHAADAHSYSHPVPLSILFGTFIALIVLTALTVAQSTVIPAAAEIYVALSIATVKGSLVMIYFMHLRHDKSFNILIILFSLAFVAVFVGFCSMDSISYQSDISTWELDTPATHP